MSCRHVGSLTSGLRGPGAKAFGGPGVWLSMDTCQTGWAFMSARAPSAVLALPRAATSDRVGHRPSTAVASSTSATTAPGYTCWVRFTPGPPIMRASWTAARVTGPGWLPTSLRRDRNRARPPDTQHHSVRFECCASTACRQPLCRCAGPCSGGSTTAAGWAGRKSFSADPLDRLPGGEQAPYRGVAERLDSTYRPGQRSVDQAHRLTTPSLRDRRAPRRHVRLSPSLPAGRSVTRGPLPSARRAGG